MQHIEGAQNEATALMMSNVKSVSSYHELNIKMEHVNACLSKS